MFKISEHVIPSIFILCAKAQGKCTVCSQRWKILIPQLPYTCNFSAREASSSKQPEFLSHSNLTQWTKTFAKKCFIPTVVISASISSSKWGRTPQHEPFLSSNTKTRRNKSRVITPSALQTAWQLQTAFLSTFLSAAVQKLSQLSNTWEKVCSVSPSPIN